MEEQILVGTLASSSPLAMTMMPLWMNMVLMQDSYYELFDLIVVFDCFF